MRPAHNQPAKSYVTSKTHKSKNLKDTHHKTLNLAQLQIKREHLLIKLPKSSPTT